MPKMKVMTMVGTRPEIIRLACVLKACDQYFDHLLVHTGQNWDYQLNEIFFHELQIRQPDYFLSAAGENLGETLGNILSKSYAILQKEKPEALLILGDTNSALSAIPAKRLKIPIFHMEAGNRCFDQNVPEEINRKIVDHISDINLPYTEHSRRYLLSEGLRPEHCFVTGSPMSEVLAHYKERIEESPALDDLGLTPGNYSLVSAHREENLEAEKTLLALVASINAVAETYQHPVIYSTHPRSLKKFEEKEVKFHPLVRNLKPFGFFAYNKLQQHAYCVLSDSGTLSEESALLNFPAVLIRTSTERPEVLDKGSMIIGGVRPQEVLPAIALARCLFDAQEKTALPADYMDLNVSIKVVKLIQSYTKLINHSVWRKES